MIVKNIASKYCPIEARTSSTADHLNALGNHSLFFSEMLIDISVLATVDHKNEKFKSTEAKFHHTMEIKRS